MNHLIWSASCLIMLMTLNLSCEEVTVFGEKEQENRSLTEETLTVGSCNNDEDCPQWSCVSSSCIDGECLPERSALPRLSMTAVNLDEAVTSVSVFGDRMVALVGELNQEFTGPNSLGIGTKLLSWALEEPYPEDRNLQSIKAYEDANWIPDASWTPNLQRISYTASLDPEEPLIENREPLDLRAVTLQEDKVWIHAGMELRDLWWGEIGQTPSNGRYFRLAAPAQAITVDQDEAWVSVYDKGLERLSLLDESEESDGLSPEPNARFNTPGRALFSKAGRSFVVVADGYAGLSLFSKRAQSGLDQSNVARRLVTPPQELSSQGRTQHLDLIEDRIISAEFGSGVRVTRVSAEGSLSKEVQFELGAAVRWVKWIDPYTALVWVDGRGVISLDFLKLDPLPEIIAELNTNQEEEQASKAMVWSAHGRRFALVNDEGTLYHGKLSCTP